MEQLVLDLAKSGPSVLGLLVITGVVFCVVMTLVGIGRGGVAIASKVANRGQGER